MAMFDDIFSGASGLAASLLDMMGTTATYVHHVDGTFNPRTNTQTGASVTSGTVTVSPALKYKTYERADTSIQRNDCKIIGKSTDFTNINDTKDQIVLNGIRYTIVAHDTISTGQQNACVKMQVRRKDD